MKRKSLSWNRLISSVFDSKRRVRDSREATLNFQVNRSSWREAAPPDQGDDIWRVNACCAQYSFFKAARFNEERRGEKGGEFIRGAACSSLCQQRQRELISFSLAEKAAQRRSKKRASNELKGNSSGNYVDFSIFFPSIAPLSPDWFIKFSPPLSPLIG